MLLAWTATALGVLTKGPVAAAIPAAVTLAAPNAEQILLDYLTRLKQAVSEGVDGAPDLAATRNIIPDQFESVELIPGGSFGHATRAEGFIPALGNPVVTTENGEPAYWLLVRLRWSAVDAGTFSPIGQEMPVPWAGQYPPGFLCRYCWW